MEITREQTLAIARLAMLKLTDQEMEKYRKDLSAILSHVEKLGEVDTGDVPPLEQVFPIATRLREDIPGTPVPVTEILKNAPETEGDHFIVPKVIP